jgi:hypothetical protein
MNTASKHLRILIAIIALLMFSTVAFAQQPRPLTITHGPNIEYIGPHSAEIAWTTSTGGSAVIHYGTDPNNLNQVAQTAYDKGDGAEHVTHRVLIKNLQPKTKYYFVVDSGQGQGTGTEVKSQVSSFTTK